MQLARIVVGVDVTSASFRAAKWVAKSFAPDAEVVLVHCLNPVLAGRRLAETRAAVATCLADLQHQIGAGRCSQRIRIGDPARCLARLAAEVDAALIAVGVHEDHLDRLIALGSTAERLVRCASVPVLLCSATPHAAPQSVLLLLDSAEVSTELADWTGTLADRFGAKVALVHVDARESERAPTSHPHHRRRNTTPWRRLARKLPPQRVFVDAVPGDRADAVLAESQRFGTELVLLQAPDEDLPFDSSTSRVLRGSACPVLVFPSATRRELVSDRVAAGDGLELRSAL